MIKSIKIYTLNLNGIRAAFRNGVFDWAKKENPDILCFQEIKAKEKDMPQPIMALNGFYKYFNPAQKSGYAGTAVFTKIKPLKLIDKIGVSKFDAEGRIMLLEFENFYLLNAYFPHSQRGLTRLEFKREFNNAYLKFIKQFKNKPLILTGDFNVAHQEIDLKNPKENVHNAGFTLEERKFIDALTNQGFVDVFRYFYPKKEKYTWWSYRFNARKRGIGWRVDYLFVPKAIIKQVRQVKIMDDIFGSDHCPVKLELALDFSAK